MHSWWMVVCCKDVEIPHIVQPTHVLRFCTPIFLFAMLVNEVKGLCFTMVHHDVWCMYLNSCTPSCHGQLLLQGRKLLSLNSNTSASSSSSSSQDRIAAALGTASQEVAKLAVAAGVNMAAGTLDFFLMEWFHHDRGNMW